MRFLDLFAGIGGFRLGMEMAGHECVGYVEIDKFARQSYTAIHDSEGEWTAHDITTVTDEHIRQLGSEHGPIDVICGGFPCQAFSVAGKRGGFDDTRGTLFFEIMRYASILRPRYLFLENVEGLLNHDNGNTFETILGTLDEVGYDAEWDVLNSKDFGVPQNRERVFIIGHLRRGSTGKVFPIGGNDEPTSQLQRQQVYSNTVTARYGAASGVGSYLLERKQHAQGVRIKEATQQGYAIAEPGDSINFQFPDSKTRRGRVGKGVAQTLETSVNQGVLTEGFRIRKLTPRECWRLQGFPDWAFDKAKWYSLEETKKLHESSKFKNKRNIPLETRAERMSDSQLYKQAGNSVTVNVIYEIAKELR